MTQTILVVVHLFLALGLIGLILMQHGKGADAGAAFGSGASGTVFGARGAANFLSRSTAILAVLFLVTSLALAWFSMQTTERPGLMQEQQFEEVETKPITTPPPANEVPVVPGQATEAPTGVSSVPVISTPPIDEGASKTEE